MEKKYKRNYKPKPKLSPTDLALQRIDRRLKMLRHELGVKLIRESEGLYPAVSRVKLAKKMGVHYTTVHYWFRGRSEPSNTEQLMRLAKLLGISLEQLCQDLTDQQKRWRAGVKNPGRRIDKEEVEVGGEVLSSVKMSKTRQEKQQQQQQRQQQRQLDKGSLDNKGSRIKS